MSQAPGARPVETYQNADLAGFLRSRRERISPGTVGFAQGPRRRTAGLRREEVAMLAHVSPTWYAYLEQGRRVRPSREVIDSLAAALRLDRTERLYLHALCRPRPTSGTQGGMPDADSVAAVRTLVLATDDMATPVYAVDPTGALIAGNVHLPRWYPGFGLGEDEEPNVFRWLLVRPEARRRLADWESDAREISARVRFYAATTPANRATDDLIAGLIAESDDFRAWWQAYEVADQHPKTRSFTAPGGGVTTLQLIVLRLAVSPSVTIVVHAPTS